MLFAKQHPRMKRHEFILDSETLKGIGVKLTTFRKKLRETALEMHRQDALWLEEDINDITILADRMNRGYFKGQIQ